MTVIKTKFGFGGANLTPGGHGKPTLVDTLRDIADDLANQAADSQILEDEVVVVATNVGLLLFEAEHINYVFGTVGNTTGQKSRIPNGETLITLEYHLGSDNRTLTFFGTDAITEAKVGYKKRATQPAELTPANAENYVLEDGFTLLVSIDDGAPQTVLFETGDFSNIAAATAAEVAAVITTDLSDASAFDNGGSPTIRTDSRGAGSSIQVTGGTANAILGYAITKVNADQIKTQKG